MKSAIEKRTINGVLINILSFLVTFGQNILLVPIFLKYWGNDRYGLWIGLTAVYGILQTLDTGHQAFVGNEISRDYHLDFKKLKVVLASSIWMAIIIGLLEVLTVVFIICSGFLSQILKINQEHVFNDASIGLLILVSTWIFYGSIGGIIVKLYLPSGLYVKGMWLGILVRLSQSLTILMVLYSGGSILHTCIGVSIVQTIISCFIIWDVCNSFPSLYPFWKDGSWKIGWLNLSKSLVITGVGLMTQLQTNGIILLVSSIFGAATAPVFTTVRTLANTFIQATAIITQPLTPDIIRYHAQGEHQKLTGTISASWWSSGILINFGILATLPFVQTFYLNWTGGKIGFDLTLYLLLAWSISLKNFGTPLIAYLAGINHLRSQSAIAVIQSAIIIGVTILFLQQGGIVTIGWATVVAEILASVVLPIYYASHSIGQIGGSISRKQLFLSLFAVGIVGAIFVGVSFKYWDVYIGSVIGIPLLLIIYWFEWIELPIEIKIRLMKLIPFLQYKRK